MTTPKRFLVHATATVLLLISAPRAVARAAEVGDQVREWVVAAKAQVDSVSAGELAELREDGEDLTLLDVRTEAEFDAGHLRGAVWVPRGKLEFDAAKGQLPPADAELVVYCKRDGRSALCAAALVRLGYERVKYLRGGFDAWVTAGYPIFNMHGELTVTELGKRETDEH